MLCQHFSVLHQSFNQNSQILKVNVPKPKFKNFGGPNPKLTKKTIFLIIKLKLPWIERFILENVLKVTLGWIWKFTTMIKNYWYLKSFFSELIAQRKPWVSCWFHYDLDILERKVVQSLILKINNITTSILSILWLLKSTLPQMFSCICSMLTFKMIDVTSNIYIQAQEIKNESPESSWSGNNMKTFLFAKNRTWI